MWRVRERNWERQRELVLKVVLHDCRVWRVPNHQDKLAGQNPGNRVDAGVSV